MKLDLGLLTLQFAAFMLSGVAGKPENGVLRVLFVGNSFTFRNGGLAAAVTYLVKETTGGDAITAQYAIRSHTWTMSAADAMNSSTALHSLLGPGGNQTWDYVILQENSKYGTYKNKEERDSTEALLQLARLAKARSAQVCLLLTWATLADKSATNFKTSQALLDDHYLRAAAAVKADTGLDAFIAPAGLAWQKIYNEMNTTVAGIPTGLDRFLALYNPSDLRHPSSLGTLLAACTITSAITGCKSVNGDTGVLGTDISWSSYLKDTSDSVVFQPNFSITLPSYPWQLKTGLNTVLPCLPGNSTILY